MQWNLEDPFHFCVKVSSFVCFLTFYIHFVSAYGVTTNEVTTFINASSCTYSFQPIQRPIIFDLPLKALIDDTSPKPMEKAKKNKHKCNLL